MKITFAVIVDDQTIGTRTSGTMPYTDAVIVRDTADSGWKVLSYHLSLTGAVKASDAKYVRSHYAEVQVVPTVPVKASGKFDASKYRSADDAAVWQPLYQAARARMLDDRFSSASVPTQAQRDEAIDRELAAVAEHREAVVNTAPSARALAIAERLNAEAQAVDGREAGDDTINSMDEHNAAAIDNGANPHVPPADAAATVRNMFKGLGWSVTEPVDAEDVDVDEPIVAIAADGEPAPADGLRRPIVKATREAMAACAAVGLAYWSDHPQPGHVWAVDAAQQPHPVRIDRKRNLAIIAEPNDAIGGNPLVSWSIDADDRGMDELTADTCNAVMHLADVAEDRPRGSRVTIGDMLGALGDRAIVAHIGAGPVVDVLTAQPSIAAKISAAKSGKAVAGHVVTKIADAAVQAPASGDEAQASAAPAPLGVNARKALLAAMVQSSLDKMIAELTADELATLSMSPEQVLAQIKMWLRRSGRAMIYGDGKGVTGGDVD